MTENLSRFYPINMLNEEFYDHYFANTSFRLEAIKCYLQNTNGVEQCDRSKAKYNTQFICALKESPLFMDDFLVALNESLMPQQSIAIDEKLRVIFDRWEAQYQREERTDRSFKRICELIQNSRKFKCPWTYQEVSAALATVKKATYDS